MDYFVEYFHIVEDYIGDFDIVDYFPYHQDFGHFDCLVEKKKKIILEIKELFSFIIRLNLIIK